MAGSANQTITTAETLDKYSLYNDEQLLSLIARHDESAFRIIYTRYWKPLYFSAYNIIRSEQAAEDIIQEVFLQLWKKRNSINIQTSLSSYLFAITRFMVYKQVRNNQQTHFFELLDERLLQGNLTDDQLFRELQNEIQQLVSQLPDKCQQVYRLSREADLSHKEIADCMDVSTKTVANHLTRALAHLKTSLGSFFSFIFL